MRPGDLPLWVSCVEVLLRATLGDLFLLRGLLWILLCDVGVGELFL